MADNNQIPAYPLMFDPSQFANKYSPFAGKALPWPSQYQGTPTDALGLRLIQSYTDTQAQHDAWAQANFPAPAAPQGTTLNSQPGRASNVMQQAGYGDWSALAPKISDDPQQQANYAYNLGLGQKLDYSRPDPTTGKFLSYAAARRCGGRSSTARRGVAERRPPRQPIPTT